MRNLDASNQEAALAHKYRQIETIATFGGAGDLLPASTDQLFHGIRESFSPKLFYMAARMGFC